MSLACRRCLGATEVVKVRPLQDGGVRRRLECKAGCLDEHGDPFRFASREYDESRFVRDEPDDPDDQSFPPVR